MTDGFYIFRRIFLNHFYELVKAFRVLCDEVLIHQAFGINHVTQGIDKSQVGTALELQMDIRNTGSFNYTWIRADDGCALLLCTDDLALDDGMGIRPVVSKVCLLYTSRCV